MDRPGWTIFRRVYTYPAGALLPLLISFFSLSFLGSPVTIERLMIAINGRGQGDALFEQGLVMAPIRRRHVWNRSYHGGQYM
jgi:hypothetical protein